jgi:hypothetical protein
MDTAGRGRWRLLLPLNAYDPSRRSDRLRYEVVDLKVCQDWRCVGDKYGRRDFRILAHDGMKLRKMDGWMVVCSSLEGIKWQAQGSLKWGGRTCDLSSNPRLADGPVGHR